MSESDKNHALFEKTAKHINLTAKFLKEAQQVSKTGKVNTFVTRRPVSLDPRLIDSVDRGKLEEIIKIQSNKPQEKKLDNISKRELEDALRNFHNRSLSPQLTAENIEKRDKLARASKRLAEDAVRKSQNRSLSPKLLQRLDSKSKVTIEELTEHNRYIKEKQESNIVLPVISTSPLSHYAKTGLSTPTYIKENQFTPVAFQAFQPKRMTSTGDYDSSIELCGSPSPGGETGGETDDDFSDKNIFVSTFPFVEDDEISKHKKLNKEAEKKSKKKTLLSQGYLDYLQRLKLTRKAIAEKEKEARDARKEKKKLLLKSQLKPKVIPETKVETPPPEIPEKAVEECIKLGKVIQSFRYSYAIEDYYNDRIRRSFDSVAGTDNTEDELKNGWLVKTLGSNVLNMNMRFLPSCNPFELRRRRQMLRARAAEETRLLRRLSTNDSMKSRSSKVHFQEPVARLQSIYERHGSIQSELKSESVKSDTNTTPRFSISERPQRLSIAERKDSVSSGTGLLPKRRKSSMKVPQVVGNGDGRTKVDLIINMTTLSSGS